MGEGQVLSAQSPKEIRRLIQQTRFSLSNKVDALEHEVKLTVNEVRCSVKDSVDKVKKTFDIKYQVREHPWAFIGGSVALGVAVGRAISLRRERNFLNGSSPHSEGTVSAESLPRFPNFSPLPATRATYRFSDELKDLKRIAIGALFGTFRELAKDSVPIALSEKVGMVIDNATRKLGGDPLPGRIRG